VPIPRGSGYQLSTNNTRVFFEETRLCGGGGTHCNWVCVVGLASVFAKNRANLNIRTNQTITLHPHQPNPSTPWWAYIWAFFVPSFKQRQFGSYLSVNRLNLQHLVSRCIVFHRSLLLTNLQETQSLESWRSSFPLLLNEFATLGFGGILGLLCMNLWKLTRREIMLCIGKPIRKITLISCAYLFL